MFKMLSKRKRSFKNKYKLQCLLGAGAFSEVFLAAIKDRPGQQYAIKIIEKKSLRGVEDSLENEISVLKMFSGFHDSQLSHPNIVKIFETFEDSSKVYLVMELVTGGELFDRIVEKGSYTEKDAVHLLKQILEAVNFMHSHGVAHRDLKPENLLYYSHHEDSKIMITDFGLAKKEDENGLLKTDCGTLGYVAPEVLSRKPYTKAVDVWSIGVIAFILLCGFPPFNDTNDVVLCDKILRGEYQFHSPYWDDVSESAKDFIKNLLCLNVEERYTCTQALGHPWISGDMAISKNIHDSVAKQLKKSSSRWKKAIHVARIIQKMRRLALNSASNTNIQRSVPIGTASTDELATDAQLTSGSSLIISMPPIATKSLPKISTNYIFRRKTI